MPGRGPFPVDELGKLAAQVFQEEGPAALNYGPTEGELALRKEIAKATREEGVHVDIDQILITTGGMQGLDLAMKLLVDPGDAVVVETPTYANAICTIANYEGQFLSIPVDEHGMRVEELAELLATGKVRPKLVYAIPTFQNPTGVTMSVARRRLLLDLAEEYRFLIVEDDPYSRLRYDGEPLPSLFALDGGRGRVVAVHTFAKILSPGLRVGWVLGPVATIRRMVAAKHSMDTCTNQLGQKIVARFSASGQLGAYIASLKESYRYRRDLMLAALEKHFGDAEGVSWNRPDGGFFIWLWLPGRVSADELLRVALKQGLAFVPGSAFAPTDDDRRCLRNALRLNFTFPDPGQIQEGIARLRRAYDSMF